MAKSGRQRTTPAATFEVKCEPTTVLELIELGERVLEDSTHIDANHDKRGEAQLLLEFCTGASPGALDHDHRPPKRVSERYLSLVARRAGGEPVALMTGRTEFDGLEFRVSRGTFVPRGSSIQLVKRAAGRIRRRRHPVLVDLGTGVGPVALALAHRFPEAAVWGLDISETALGQARRNARHLGVGNVTFRRSDLYAALPRALAGTVDVITGNVPYVRPDEIPTMDSEIREYEPLSSLTDLSGDGFGLLQRVVGEAPKWLRPGGSLLLEVTPDVAPKLRRLFARAGLTDSTLHEDDMWWSGVVEGRTPRS